MKRFTSTIKSMKIIQIVLLSCFLCSATAVVHVPAYISDRMMFQREMPVNVWGWADKGESVIVRLSGQSQVDRVAENSSFTIAGGLAISYRRMETQYAEINGRQRFRETNSHKDLLLICY
jgi:hypothetical protein